MNMTATIYRIKFHIDKALEELQSLNYIDENRHKKQVENFGDRRREIWKEIACPSNKHWQPRPDSTPMKHVGGPKNGMPIVPDEEEFELPAFLCFAKRA